MHLVLRMAMLQMRSHGTAGLMRSRRSLLLLLLLLLILQRLLLLMQKVLLLEVGVRTTRNLPLQHRRTSGSKPSKRLLPLHHTRLLLLWRLLLLLLRRLLLLRWGYLLRLLAHPT